jgi:hypothetical protein
MRLLTPVRAAAAAWLLASGASAASAQLHRGLELWQPLEVPAVSAVTVLATTRTDTGVTARLMNVAAQPIVAVQVLVGERLADEGHVQFMGVSSLSPIDWPPGGEQVIVIWTEGLSDAPDVRVRAVVLADGTGDGDPRVVRAFKRRFADLHDGALGVLRVLEPAAPVSDEDLPRLIDRIGREMTAVPRDAGRPEQFEAHEAAIDTLRRLQGRDLPAERLDREFASLRRRLEALRDAAARFPFQWLSR